MYLESLELHGFKSFADRTVVRFAPGVTAIVGPNGCGKSNIIDAVRWVIGEQRARVLRADRMENVIFNGSADRRRLGMAEVSMTVENTRHVLPTEFTEVKITRRLYRSGESEYLLNDRPCRLRDIQDLFMDTGMGAGAYSVIELKMIEDILSENAHDRRHLFEEAAGITKYKLRRTQTLRKLDATQADLTRIKDIVDEVGRNVRSLERQAKKAAKYRALSEEMQTVSIQVAFFDFDALTRERSALEKERGALDDRIQELTVQQVGDDAQLESKRTELLDRERDLSTAQTTLNDHVDRIRRLESESRVQDERISSAKLALDRAEREREESAHRRAVLLQTVEQLTSKRDEIEPRHQEALKRLLAAQEERDRLQKVVDEMRANSEAIRREESELQRDHAEHVHRQSRLTNRIELHQEETERISLQRQAIASGNETLDGRRDANRHELQKAITKVTDIETVLKQSEADLLQAQKDIETAQNEFHQLERRREGLKAEAALLESLLISQEEAGEAVQYLAADGGWSTSAPATVADLVGCDPEYAAAVESALGSYADCLVVSSEQEVDKALAVLKESGKGSAAFIVLDRLRIPPVAEQIDGTSPLRNVVRVTDKKLAALTQLLFYDTYVVDTLEEARSLAREHGETRPALRFIATSGEWADAAGRVHGGGQPSKSQESTSRIGRKERLNELDAQIKRLSGKSVQASSRIEQLRANASAILVGDIRMQVREAETVRARLDQERARIDSEAESLARNVAQIDERLKTVAASLESDDKELASLAGELQKLAASVEETAQRRREAETAFQRSEYDARKAEVTFGEINVEAVQVKHEVDTIERDRRRAENDLTDLAARDESREREIADFAQRIADAKTQRDNCREQVTTGYQEKTSLDEAVLDAEETVSLLRATISEQDVMLREVRRLREAAMQDEGSRLTRLAELNAKLEALADRIRTDFEIELEDVELELPEDFDKPTARRRTQELRDKLRNMGAVNELALESYEEEKERFDFMSAQQEDLEKAEKTLIDTIEEINETASERFTSTFEKIQVSFSMLFKRLFGEDASASVSISEDGDPLEVPIEIVARPSGKKNVIISQLSGGEKALTATALLFAIYLVKPSPFCILDEVDAPLDDANVERFMKLLHEFSESTQFILVTHNKLTMEAADRMYGITMEQQGVSKLVSVDFEESTPESESESEAA